MPITKREGRLPQHVHDLVPFPTKNFDVSHTINKLSFGEPFPGRKSPLDGVKRSGCLVSVELSTRACISARPPTPPPPPPSLPFRHGCYAVRKSGLQSDAVRLHAFYSAQFIGHLALPGFRFPLEHT